MLTSNAFLATHLSTHSDIRFNIHLGIHHNIHVDLHLKLYLDLHLNIYEYLMFDQQYLGSGDTAYLDISVYVSPLCN